MDYHHLTAPCGIDCFNCQLFAGNAETPARLALNRLQPRFAGVLCRSCRAQNCALLESPCPTRQCAADHQVGFCFECAEFPCTRLAPMADQAARVPHNLKVYNLCRIKAVGVESWAATEAQANRNRYFNGRFQIGAGPQTS